MKEKIEKIFNTDKPVIGMVHILPVKNVYDVRRAIQQAVEDAVHLEQGGVHGLIIENAGDSPFMIGDSIDYSTIVLMSIIASKISNKVNIPFGINVITNGVKQAITIAKITGGKFVRATGWTNGYFSSCGFVEPTASESSRYAKQIGAEDILVLSDVMVKNGSHLFTSDKSILELSKDIENANADAVIVTGSSTGVEPNIDELKKVRDAINIPTFVGSGASTENLKYQINESDGFIIGTYFKENRDMIEPVLLNKVKEFMNEYNKLRGLV